MKVIYNKFIPFREFSYINLFGVLFVRGTKSKKITESSMTHETIHTLQMKELLYIGFYILYILFWIERIFWNAKKAYEGIPFEQEAYANQNDTSYLTNRKHYAWIKYIFKKK